MANKIVQCYLCGRKDAVEVEQNTLDSIIDYEEIYCEENCGKYIISNLDRKKQELQNLSQDKKDKLASYANEFNYDHKGLTLILTNDLSKIYSYETGDYKEKYHQFYRQGKTYDEALYEVAKFIEERRLLKREYQDFEEVISLWEDQAPKDKKRTKPDVVNIMQEFAFLLENKTYIDAAVGTGGILKGLDKNTYIYDNDEKLIEVAKIVRAQYTKYNISPIVSLEQKKDSIASYEVFRFCNLAFFDPPMGDRRVKPEEWDNIYRAGQTQELHSKEVLGDYGKNSQSTTEILFLTNFLITARHDASFIGLFPESILNRNNKEYNSLRKYLVKNSLIAAIKAPSGHVVLVGKKYREGKYKHISVFRMEKLLPREKLKELFEKAIQGKPFEEGDKDKNKYGYIQYSFKELLEDKTCYINLPIVNVNEEPPRPPKEVIDDIKVNEKELEPLKLHIISGEILEYASDVIRLGVTETTDIVKSQWFEKDKNSLLNKFYERKYFNVSNDENQKSEIHYVKTSWESDSFWEDSGQEATSFFNLLKKLHKKGRIKKDENNKLIIDYSENTPEKEHVEDYNKFISPSNFDEKITELLTLCGDKNINIFYELLCKFWFSEEKDETLLEETEIKSKEVVRSIKVLEEFGLVIEEIKEEPEKEKANDSDKKNKFYLYNKYRPYHPIIDGEA